jgi:hypothetical protein
VSEVNFYRDFTPCKSRFIISCLGTMLIKSGTDMYFQYCTVVAIKCPMGVWLLNWRNKAALVLIKVLKCRFQYMCE